MNDCIHRIRVGRLHDGELPAAEAAELERHIATCVVCAEERLRLSQESELFARFGDASAKPVTARFHEAFDDAVDEPITVLRIATALAGLAASIAIVGLVWLHESPAMQESGPGRVLIVSTNNTEWERLATTFELDSRPSILSDPRVERRQMLADAAMANWMVSQMGPELTNEGH